MQRKYVFVDGSVISIMNSWKTLIRICARTEVTECANDREEDERKIQLSVQSDWDVCSEMALACHATAFYWINKLSAGNLLLNKWYIVFGHCGAGRVFAMSPRMLLLRRTNVITRYESAVKLAFKFSGAAIPGPNRCLVLPIPLVS